MLSFTPCCPTDRLRPTVEMETQQRLNLTQDPAKVQTDFELAAIRAVERERVPQSRDKGMLLPLLSGFVEEGPGSRPCSDLQGNPEFSCWSVEQLL